MPHRERRVILISLMMAYGYKRKRRYNFKRRPAYRRNYRRRSTRRPTGVPLTRYATTRAARARIAASRRRTDTAAPPGYRSSMKRYADWIPSRDQIKRFAGDLQQAWKSPHWQRFTNPAGLTFDEMRQLAADSIPWHPDPNERLIGF